MCRGQGSEAAQARLAGAGWLRLGDQPLDHLFETHRAAPGVDRHVQLQGVEYLFQATDEVPGIDIQLRQAGWRGGVCRHQSEQVAQALQQRLAQCRVGGRRAFAEGFQQLPGACAQAGVVTGRQQDQPGLPGIGRRLCCFGGLQHHMGVDPAKAEGADAGQQRPVRSQRRVAAGQSKRAVVEADLRVEWLLVQVADLLPVLQAQQALDHRGDPGSGFQVADLAFQRTQHDGRVVVVDGHGFFQRIDFNRVAQRRAGAVGFDQLGLARRMPGLLPGVLDDFGLGLGVGRGEAVGAATVVLRAAEHLAVDVVAVVARCVQRGQHQRRHAFAAHVAVGLGAEGLAVPGVAEHAGLGEGDEQLRAEQQVDPADDGQLALAGPQCLAGVVQRHQRTGAGGVDAFAGAVQVQAVRHPVGNRGQGDAGAAPGVAGHAVTAHQRRVVGMADADEHPDPPPGQLRRRITGVFQRGPGALQKQPLLRVHALRFARQDAEEASVEAVHMLDKAAALAIAGVFAGVQLAVVVAPVPALGRHLADRVAPLVQQRPEGAQVRSAGKPPGHADHCQRLGSHCWHALSSTTSATSTCGWHSAFSVW